MYEELLASDEHTDRKVYDKIFVGKVNNKPIGEVLDFVSKIGCYSGNELKTILINYANGKNEENIEENVSFTLNSRPAFANGYK